MAVLNEQPGIAQPQPEIDEAKLNAFMGKAVDDWGVLTSAALVVIGDKLGLYSALTEGGPATPSELAQESKERDGHRYVRRRTRTDRRHTSSVNVAKADPGGREPTA